MFRDGIVMLATARLRVKSGKAVEEAVACVEMELFITQLHLEEKLRVCSFPRFHVGCEGTSLRESVVHGFTVYTSF